jgi:hypothetical protein
VTETPQPVSFAEDDVPLAGIEEGVEELVDLYGGEITAREVTSRRFTLPLRRGISTGGGVECSLSWSESGEVTMTCDRDIDAPKVQRVLLLVVGVIGALLFTIWPFFPQRREWGALAWIGGAVAIAVYFMTLRKTSGGLALDFLHRLVRRQRELNAPPSS